MLVRMSVQDLPADVAYHAHLVNCRQQPLLAQPLKGSPHTAATMASLAGQEGALASAL